MALDIDSAVKDIESQLLSGQLSSIRAAAAVYSIPEATLRRRLKGGISRQQARTTQQILTPEQEDRLIQ